MSTTPDRTRLILVDPAWLDLQNNPFFLNNPFQKNEDISAFLRRRAEGAGQNQGCQNHAKDFFHHSCLHQIFSLDRFPI